MALEPQLAGDTTCALRAPFAAHTLHALLAPGDPGLALAATTLAAAALAAASTAAATDTSIAAPSVAVVAAAAVAVAAAAVAATFVVAAAAAAVATATYIRRPAAQTQAQAQGCTSTCS
jgi:hypothetical protein